MPTNTSPEFDRQRIIYEETEDLAQRIVELEKLLSLAPRHKGAERMKGDYRKKLATLKAQLQKKKEQDRARRGGGGPEEGVVRKEGAGQICLIGVTNSGKSTLINGVTNADLDVGDLLLYNGMDTHVEYRIARKQQKQFEQVAYAV